MSFESLLDKKQLPCLNVFCRTYLRLFKLQNQMTSVRFSMVYTCGTKKSLHCVRVRQNDMDQLFRRIQKGGHSPIFQVQQDSPGQRNSTRTKKMFGVNRSPPRKSWCIHRSLATDIMCSIPTRRSINLSWRCTRDHLVDISTGHRRAFQLPTASVLGSSL